MRFDSLGLHPLVLKAVEAAGYTDSFSLTSDGEGFLSWTDAESTSGAGRIVTTGKADVDGYSKVSLSITGPE